MPITPLHFGPALAIHALVGSRYFGLWAFTVTQVALDAEPAVKLFFNLSGELHSLTHNPLVGGIYAVLTILVCWRWERFAAITGATFGITSHLWLDAKYHHEVAVALARWGDTFTMRENAAPFDVELFCFLSFLFWGLVVAIRSVIRRRGGY